MQAKTATNPAIVLLELNSSFEALLERVAAPLRDVCGHLLFSGSRVRSLLLVTALGDADESEYRQAVKAACCLELLHTATLIQDDIFDQGHTRRGCTATHLVYGVSLATLASDWLLLEAMRLAAEVSQPFAELLMRASQTMTTAEALELSPPRIDTFDQAWHHVREVASGKTGVLFAAALAGAAVIRRLPTEQVEQMWHLGCELGITFQMQDDCKDLFSSTEEIGKDVQQDISAGRLTAPSLRVCEEWRGPEEPASMLRALIERRLTRRNRQEMQRLLQGPIKQTLHKSLARRCAEHQEAITAASLPASVAILVQTLCAPQSPEASLDPRSTQSAREFAGGALAKVRARTF